MRNYQTDTTYLTTPARQPSVASDVYVPLLQAIVTGALGAGLAGLLATALTLNLFIVPCVGLALFATTWLLLLVDHRRLLWTIEAREEIAAHTPQSPVAAAPRMVLEVAHTGTRKGLDFLHLPVTPEIFTTWARAALAGQSISVGAWVGRGRPFTRGEYETFLAELERAGIVRLLDVRNPQAGRELTRPGRAALRAAVRMHGGDTSMHATQGEE